MDIMHILEARLMNYAGGSKQKDAPKKKIKYELNVNTLSITADVHGGKPYFARMSTCKLVTRRLGFGSQGTLPADLGYESTLLS